MTNPAAAAEAFVALAALIGLACFFYGPWQTLLTDLTRQIIFERRDRLFGMALVGRLAFDSDAYRGARAAMNAQLRFAHHLTWQEIAITVYRAHKAGIRPPKWRDSLSSLPPAVRMEIDDLLKECSVAMAGMALLKSIFVGPFAIIFVIFAVCTSGLNKIMRRAARVERFEVVNDTIQKTSAEYAENELLCAA